MLFAGTGTGGAYHAGVLRAFAEAGVKIDLVGGRGVGAIAAVFSAVDGGAKLWEVSGLWHDRAVRRLYALRFSYSAAAVAIAVTFVVLAAPLLLVLVDAVYYVMALTVRIGGLTPVGGLARLRDRIFDVAYAGGTLPDLIARAAVAPLMLLGVYVLVTLIWRRARGRPLLDPPLSIRRFARALEQRLWLLVRGVSPARRPASAEDLSRRYLALLAENVGQPGFRELLLLVRDLDTRSDLACVSLGDDYRRFYVHARAAGKAPARRAAASGSDYLDLRAEENQPVLVAALEAALSLPVVTAPVQFAFPHESFWRGEVHRLCGPSAGDARLVAEAVAAGAEQVILVTPAPVDLPGPRGVVRHVWSLRAAAGEDAVVSDAAAARSAIEQASAASHPAFTLFVIRPDENPLGAFDFDGRHDWRAGRAASAEDLLHAGYHDAYRLFIEPVVGASGERIAAGG